MNESIDGCVWILNPTMLNSRALGTKTLIRSDSGLLGRHISPPGERVFRAMFPAAFHALNPSSAGELFCRTFTIHGDDMRGIEEMVAGEETPVLSRIMIRGDRKRVLLRELHDAGISFYTISPDIPGRCREIVYKYTDFFNTDYYDRAADIRAACSDSARDMIAAMIDSNLAGHGKEPSPRGAPPPPPHGDVLDTVQDEPPGIRRLSEIRRRIDETGNEHAADPPPGHRRRPVTEALSFLREEEGAETRTLPVVEPGDGESSISLTQLISIDDASHKPGDAPPSGTDSGNGEKRDHLPTVEEVTERLNALFKSRKNES